VLFAKEPRPGTVKTRLCPPLTPTDAARLYSGFLRELLAPVEGFRTLCYGWPEAGLGALEALAAPGVEFRPQRGGDLWERMERCFAELFDEGHDRIVLRNTDSPDLPEARLREAAAMAAPGRVVLGPDPGGGYYLVALGAPCPGLFWTPPAEAGPEQGLDEGAPTACAATAARARTRGCDVHFLAEEPDVDTFDDLVQLWRRRLRARGDVP